MTKILILIIALAVAGCAAGSNYQPTVDWRHPNFKGMAVYNRDVADCRRYAENISPVEGAVGGGILGALMGAAFGAATGAIIGDAGYGAALGAAAGGSAGVIAGAGAGITEQVQVIRTCLRGRGHPVLN
jgi:hypothetical protein